MNAESQPHRIRIGIFHPADPAGPIPGGIDTVVRGVLAHAPADLDYTLFGATSDCSVRPIGEEISIQFGDRTARFIPVVAADPSAARGLVPLSVRYMWELRRYLKSGRMRDIDIFDFHRIEPVAMFKSDRRPKNVMLHQDMAVIRDKNCDIGWRHAPWLYEALERSLFGAISRVFCVRQSAVSRYQSTYPQWADRFSFIPTWVEFGLFQPSGHAESRSRIIGRLALHTDSRLLISVGRLDRQKDPLLMLEALARSVKVRPDLHLLIIGDGSMRLQVQERVRALGLDNNVTLLGALRPAQVAEYLRASDIFILSSAYEGMPIVVLEALATGIPVVTTNVGEIGRVVRHGINGAVVAVRSPEALAQGICDTLDNLNVLRGAPCEQAVIPYYPDRVLSQIYDNHRAQGNAPKSSP